jgi:hypothetical protein
MNAKAYFKTHAKTEGSVMGMFEEPIIQLMEGYAIIKVLERTEPLIPPPLSSIEDDGPVIKHFQDDCQPPPDDGYGSVLEVRISGETINLIYSPSVNLNHSK